MDGETTDLLERYLDDTIDAAGATALVKRLDADPEFRREFCAALRMHGLLHASLDPDTAEQFLEWIGGFREGQLDFH